MWSARPVSIAAAFFGWLTEFRPTWYTAVPSIHRALLSAASRYKRSAPRRSLRLIRSASSSLPPDVLGGLEALFGVPVIETYGMTEAATQIAANPMGRRKLGSVGQSAGAEIAIMDSEGRRLPAGERGEIVLRGPTITRGYDNDDRGQRVRVSGRLVPNRRPRIPGSGRISLHCWPNQQADVINRGGQKVAPAEVEEALLSHPDVVEAAVFPIPHVRLGEDVAAAVVLRPGCQDQPHKATRLRQRTPGRIQGPWPDPDRAGDPKGPGGKVKRSGLARRAFNNAADVRRAERGGRLVPPRSDLERRLAKIWADLLELNRDRRRPGCLRARRGLPYGDADAFASAGTLWSRFLVQGYLRCADRCAPSQLASSI